MYDFAKLLGVAWAAVYCFLFSFIVSRTLDNLTPKLDRTKPKWMTFMEVVMQFGLIGLIVYGARMIVKKIPFPIDLSQIGELRSLPLMVFIFMFFQTRVQDKMRFLMA